MLEVVEATAGYGHGPDILNDISLTVELGRRYCIIGPNGAGKSTLLRLICGIIAPRSGDVRFEGRSVGGLRPDQLLEVGISYVPQERTVFPSMSVKENLVMGGFTIKDKGLVNERLATVYRLFPVLGERHGQLAGTLSGGEQQMVTLGRALMVQPKVMMIDEPSLGLAPLMADQIFDTIRELSDLGITVILVEQNAYRGLQASDWGVVLDLGTKRFEGPAESILDDPRIRELYLGSQIAGKEGSA
ncbi:MAG TPA: ABC transporter ATP-binding protein [Acidimicrobiia bacterium]|jgi:branched-chain amino acid transport system ATP-binding protein